MNHRLIYILVIMAAMLPPLSQADADYPNVKDLTPVTLLSIPRHEPVTLVSHGQARAKIYVVPSDPGKMLKQMIKELVQVIRASTGVKLEMVDHTPPPDQTAIVLGDCPEARASGIDAQAIPIEGFVVKTAPKRVFLVGSTRKLHPE